MKTIGPYTETVVKHFRNPHNQGRIENPDGRGRVGNSVCGDIMELYIKIKKGNKGQEIIDDIKFETFGCVAAISTSSAITDIAKGKTLEEAMKINRKDVIESLGGLPPIKVHCSVLSADALSEAIYDYLTKNKRQIPKDLEDTHTRIQKEREEIKERYKDWIKVEEEMFKKSEGAKA